MASAGEKIVDFRGPQCTPAEQDFKAFVHRTNHPRGLITVSTQQIQSDEWILTCLLPSTATVGMMIGSEYLGTYLFKGKSRPQRIGPALEIEENPFIPHADERFHSHANGSPPTRIFISQRNEVWLIQNSVLGSTETYRVFLLENGVPLEKAVFRSPPAESGGQTSYDFSLDSHGFLVIHENHSVIGPWTHPKKKNGQLAGANSFYTKDTHTITREWNGTAFKNTGESSFQGAYEYGGPLYGILDGQLIFPSTSSSAYTLFHDKRVRVLGVASSTDWGDLIRVDVDGELQGFVRPDEIKIEFLQHYHGD
jgi:hypothetical protein